MAWILESYDGLEIRWRGSLPKSFADDDVKEVLRLLAARHLSEDEILRAARGQEDFLNLWENHKARTISAAGTSPIYVATKDHADA